ncbi:MAG TPA: hypothetical protein VJ020_05315 [Anaerolineales bacterium]|nr:hypothetical protein [Anaerolineales bacterium]
MATFETSKSNSVSLSEGPLALLTPGRIIPAVVYGALLGSVYALVSQVIDVWVLSDLPMQVDWDRATVIIAVTAVSGSLLGAVTAWPRESWKGVLVGAVTIAVWGLVKAAIELSSAALTLLFLPTFLPLVFLGLPIALLLRLVINWHDSNMNEVGLHRLRGMVLLLAAVVGVAAFAGSWAQMPAHAQEAVRKVHRGIQFAENNPGKPLSISLKGAPGVKGHLGLPYVLTQASVDSSTTGVEVNVLFEDGYALSCLIGQVGDTPVCQEGLRVFSNPGG